MSEVKLDETGLTTPSISLGGNTLSSDGDKLLWNGEEFKSSSAAVGHNVGEQWISMDGTIPLGGVPFNGQILNIADYQSLYNWAKDNSLIKTESEWQTLKTNNNSNVAYYSDYSETQFRVPLFRGYLKANETAGGYTKEGLPNITGCIGHGHSESSTGRQGSFNSDKASGAFYKDTSTTTNGQYYPEWTGKLYPVKLNASRSSSIYGNSTHVTPETNTVLVGVYAFNTVVNAAIVDSSQKLSNHLHASAALNFLTVGYPWADSSGALLVLRSANYTDNPGGFQLVAHDATSDFSLTGKTNGNLTWGGKPIIRLVESWKSGTSWYRKYSDGWIEQGGYITTSTNTEHTINLHTAFSNTNYFLVKQLGFNGYYAGGISGQFTSVWGLTTSSFKTYGYTTTGVNAFRWYACGY